MKHRLSPLGVAMAGHDVHDPYKDEGRESGPQSFWAQAMSHASALPPRADPMLPDLAIRDDTSMTQLDQESAWRSVKGLNTHARKYPQMGQFVNMD